MVISCLYGFSKKTGELSLTLAINHLVPIFALTNFNMVKQSDFFYSNYDGLTNKFLKFLTILGRNLNKNSITLADNLRNKLIILHTSNFLESHIYICTRLYTILLYGVHICTRMNTTQTQDRTTEVEN